MGGRGLCLVPFVLFIFFWFLVFFCRVQGFFISLVGRGRGSSSAGESMTSISVLGAFNSFVIRWVDFGCN